VLRFFFSTNFNNLIATLLLSITALFCEPKAREDLQLGQVRFRCADLATEILPFFEDVSRSCAREIEGCVIFCKISAREGLVACHALRFSRRCFWNL
jgi:hypothetical protein